MDEIVLGDNDQRLEVRVSIGKFINKDTNKESQECIYTSTVVQNHNKLGAFYMFFVTPMHRIIAPIMFAHLCRQQNLFC
jgi:hypothetical protein